MEREEQTHFRQHFRNSVAGSCEDQRRHWTEEESAWLGGVSFSEWASTLLLCPRGRVYFLYLLVHKLFSSSILIERQSSCQSFQKKKIFKKKQKGSRDVCSLLKVSSSVCFICWIPFLLNINDSIPCSLWEWNFLTWHHYIDSNMRSILHTWYHW